MIVLFDAVGTIIKPRPGVTEVYHRLGMKYGSRLGYADIKRRIASARRRFFNVGESAELLFESSTSFASELDDLRSSDALEREQWQELVFDVFADLQSPESLFNDLWRHFEDPDHWEVYPDVESCWDVLQQLGIKVGIASNFDSRLVSLSDQLTPLDSADYVFCSSQVGFRKPSPLFFQQIEEAIACVSDPDAADQPIVMVGDDYENDCVAPRLAGWKSIWLNRQDLLPGREHEFGAPDKQEVSSLYEFTRWLLTTMESQQ